MNSVVYRSLRIALALALLSGVLLVPGVRAAEPEPPRELPPGPPVTEDIRFRTGDGADLLVRLGGRGPLVDGHLPSRPVIVELSPYAPGCCPEYGGPGFNYLQVHIRGTGDSSGRFDALGPRTQRDLAEVMGWACEQPWSDGRFGLWGFSASAIAVYNSLHLELPCLEAAVLGSGTHELYRDLLYPGGIPNGLPALGVLGLIGAPAVQSLPARLPRDPGSLVDLASGFGDIAADYLAHPTLDSFWRQRGFRGDANDVPVLMVDGFFDVESRGAFQAFQALRDDGAHLYVVGAHDGVPQGSGGADDVTRRWFERHLLGVDNGVDQEPTVQLWLANGDRERMLGGDFVTESGDDWPIPGTEWTALHLDAARSGTAGSVNDGTLALQPSGQATLQPYVPVPSLPTATDPYTTSLLGVFDGTGLTSMEGPERLGLSYTTGPLAGDVRMAGPASLELEVTATTPDTDLYAVLSDVWPDGTAHPVAAGRLRTAFPSIDRARSLLDDEGHVVQPYNRFAAKRTIPSGREHRYFVELWPVGNQFRAGHRLRLHVIGASAYHLTLPGGPNLVRAGGPDGGSVLRVPVLPGSDLASALARQR